MISGVGNAIVLGGAIGRWGAAQAVNYNSTMIADANGEMLAIKFTPEANQHVTHVDMLLNWVGDLTAGEFKLGIYADAADIPDTGTPTLLGGLTAVFNGLSTAAGWAGGGTNPIELTTHADLIANTPYWLVLARTGGTSLDGTHTVGMRGILSIGFPIRGRLHNGTSWTAVAASTVRMGFIVKVGTSYYGLPFDTAGAASTAAHIYDTNKQGISFKTGNKMFLRGVLIELTKTGASPNDLIVTPYINTTAGSPVTKAQAGIITLVPFFVWFPTPIELTPDVITYVILSQSGTDTAKDYRLNQFTIPANYMSAVADDNFRLVYGTGTPPTTAMANEYPCMWPIITDMLVDLDQAAVGGGLLVHPGLSGRING
jgi:hypothetical protein